MLTREEIESFRRCSYSGEVLDDEGNTWVAYGTLCHGKLRLIVQTRADPLTIRGNIWGEGQTPPPTPTSGSRRMLGIEEIDVAEEAQAESWHLSDEFTTLRKNETSDGVERSMFARPVKNETDFIQRRKLLQSSTDPKYVELIMWASEDRMAALNSMSEFIEQSILQVQYMQAAFDKTSGFNRPVKLIIKHFMRTASGSSDPWGYTSFFDLYTFLNRGATWLEGQLPEKVREGTRQARLFCKHHSSEARTSSFRNVWQKVAQSVIASALVFVVLVARVRTVDV